MFPLSEPPRCYKYLHSHPQAVHRHREERGNPGECGRAASRAAEADRPGSLLEGGDHHAEAAERQKDTATQIAELEKAVESLNNGLNAMAAVARSNSDRGMIAVLNDGYRLLKGKLTKAEEAAK